MLNMIICKYLAFTITILGLAMPLKAADIFSLDATSGSALIQNPTLGIVFPGFAELHYSVAELGSSIITMSILPGETALDTFFLNMTNNTGEVIGGVDLWLGTADGNGFSASSFVTFSPIISASVFSNFPDLSVQSIDPSHRSFTTSGWAPFPDSGTAVFSFAVNIDDALVGQPLAIQWTAFAIPEPTSASLLATGALVMTRRRR